MRERPTRLNTHESLGAVPRIATPTVRSRFPAGDAGQHHRMRADHGRFGGEGRPVSPSRPARRRSEGGVALADRDPEQTGMDGPVYGFSAFAGFRFPREVITVAVRWLLAQQVVNGLRYWCCDEVARRRTRGTRARGDGETGRASSTPQAPARSRRVASGPTPSAPEGKAHLLPPSRGDEHFRSRALVPLRRYTPDTYRGAADGQLQSGRRTHPRRQKSVKDMVSELAIRSPKCGCLCAATPTVPIGFASSIGVLACGAGNQARH
jgi:hypothetical protein